jgi:porin
METSVEGIGDRLSGESMLLFWMVLLLTFFCLKPAVFAAEQKPAAEEKPYSGDILKRSTLTGDWGGVRNELAKKGVTLDLGLTQVGQGIVSGGKRTNWQYGGRGDLNLLIDTGKLGLWPGGFLNAELEGNFGNAINGKTGALMPVNTNQIFPTTGFDDLCLSALNFTQFLSHYIGLYVGKLATITASSGDMNEFAHGKGDTQFMNMAFNFNPVLVVTVPYSTLGAGFVILPTKDPKEAIINFGILNAVGTANTTGFDTLNGNKLSFAGEGRVRTCLFGLTGHQLVGVTYSNREYTSLDQSLRFFVENRAIQKQKGSWSVYYNFDQYLYETKRGSGRGYGIFGRFGASDGNPNPMHYFMSFGFGGKGISDCRPHDSFGIGYYYMWVRNPSFTGPLTTREVLGNENGGEAYYNFALTPWAILTPDVQIVRPAQQNKISVNQTVPGINTQNIETAIIGGVRLQLVF